MKKLMLCLLICVFTFSAAACGGGKPNEITTEASVTTQAPETTDAPETTAEPQTEAVTMEEPKTVMNNVYFVDPLGNKGNGTEEEPFNSIDDALKACTENSCIVLMNTVELSGDCRQPAHAGSAVITASYNGKSYNGGISFKNGCRYYLSGDTVFEDLPVRINGKAVFVADFNCITFEENVDFSGTFNEVILIGGSNGGANKQKDVHITVKSGVFTEITGGSRYGKDRNYNGTIYLTIAGTAEVNKVFVGPWGEGAYTYANGEVLIDGGRINVFINGMRGTSDRCTGVLNMYITDRFDAAKSFTTVQGSSFGISGTCPNPWGVAEDSMKKCGAVNLYCEQDNFAYLISKVKCDTSSFGSVTKICGDIPEGRSAESDLLREISAINSASPLSGGDVYRPVYHYSPKKNFLADPNGLVYNAATGEYHMYYQRHEGILRDKVRASWGHAVSKDLVNWTEQDTAMSFGHTISGSAVVDKNNTSCLFDDSIAPENRLVTVFTRSSAGKETQMLAYSLDGGYTYKLYGAVIETSKYITAENKAFRDPKVIWVEDETAKNGGVWLMVIGGGRVQLFTSEDLLHWTANSAAQTASGGAIYSECPDLFPLAVDGNSENVKWVLSCAGVSYYVGSLQKNAGGMYVFRAEYAKMDYNGTSSVKGVYATQSFFNEPKGRRVLVNWMVDKSAPLLKYDKPWDGIMSLPYEVELITLNGTPTLTQQPVKEVYSLFAEPIFEAENADIKVISVPSVESNAYYLEGVFDVSDASRITIELRKGANETTRLVYNKASSQLILGTANSGELAKESAYTFTGGSYSVKLKPDENGCITLRIFVDTVSIEVFGGQGEAVISAMVYPDAASNGISISGDAEIESLKLCPAK